MLAQAKIVEKTLNATLFNWDSIPESVSVRYGVEASLAKGSI